jgi:RNA polymerase sigma-70 factor (ECF subfamily)
VVSRSDVGRSERERQDESEKLINLMLAYQAGRPEAFETLYYALKSRLLQYLTSLALDRTKAEDLLQETFLQMHRSRRTYQPRRPVGPWAFAIARHVFLMDRRATGRRTRHESGNLEAVPELPIPPDVDRLAERELLRQGLTKLSEDRREAVLLHHVWGFSFREIGGILGIRKGTAKLRAFRGMNDLREYVNSIRERKG